MKTTAGCEARIVSSSPSSSDLGSASFAWLARISGNRSKFSGAVKMATTNGFPSVVNPSVSRRRAGEKSARWLK